jgi:hypothetical protein
MRRFQVGPFLACKITILPIHVIDLGFRPDKLFGLAVASQAPFHLKRVLLINRRHVVDLSVTGRAANAFGNVNAVIEVRELGQVVNAFPLDGFVVAQARAYGFQVRTVSPDLAMTIHTRLGRRHAGGSCCFDGCMAIPAIDPVVAYMMLMAELHRLLLLNISAGKIRRPGNLRVNVKRGAGQNRHPDHADPRNVVGAPAKKLCHFRTFATRVYNYNLEPALTQISESG